MFEVGDRLSIPGAAEAARAFIRPDGPLGPYLGAVVAPTGGHGGLGMAGGPAAAPADLESLDGAGADASDGEWQPVLAVDGAGSGAGAGIGFHRHHTAWLYLLTGRKRWALLPPDFAASPGGGRPSGAHPLDAVLPGGFNGEAIDRGPAAWFGQQLPAWLATVTTGGGGGTRGSLPAGLELCVQVPAAAIPMENPYCSC